MLGLIERLEAAEVGSRELDGLIHRLIFPDEMLMTDPGSAGPVKRAAVYQPVGSLPDIHGQVVAECLPGVARYTTSLDAALALAERVLPGSLTWRTESGGTSFTAAFWDDPEYEPVGAGRAPTPALALCIAILRARADLNTRSEGA